MTAATSNTRSRTKVYLTAAIAAASFLAAAAMAQPVSGVQQRPVTMGVPAATPRANRLPFVRITLDPSRVTRHVNPAITFKPFPILDPTTNQAISPTTIITLPNGKRPTAQQYYDELNRWEQWLNQRGYSLRTLPRGSETRLAELKVDRPLLDRQAAVVMQPNGLPSIPGFRRFVPQIPSQAILQGARPAVPMLKPTEHTELTRTLLGEQDLVTGEDALAKSETGGPPPPAPPPGPPATAKCADVSGSGNWLPEPIGGFPFSARANGSFNYSGHGCDAADKTLDDAGSRFTVKAIAGASAELFNVRENLIQLNATLESNQQKHSLSVSLTAWSEGQVIGQVNETQSTKFGPLGRRARSSLTAAPSGFHFMGFGTTLPVFDLGPVIIDLSVGVAGVSGFFTPSLLVDKTSASLLVTPLVNSHVYAEASLDAYLASAGAGGQLTLVNWTPTLSVQSGIGLKKINNKCQPVLYGAAYGESRLETLAGQLYVYAEIFWHRFTYTLFEWSGINFDTVMFNSRGSKTVDSGKRHLCFGAA